MKKAASIFRFLLDHAKQGERTALVTITGVTGSYSRAPGSHVAVTESGESIGSISGGCVEAALVGEAKRIIESGRAEIVRFGAGSPFIDIRLPCGGGIDLLVIPQPNTGVISAAFDQLQARKPVAIGMRADGTISIVPASRAGTSEWRDDSFVVHHTPDLRLLLIGEGAETRALASLAHSYGLHVTILSPERMLDTRRESEAFHHVWLKTPRRSPSLVTDYRTAVVFLFHDHDWETELLAQALEQEALYVGAMGSRASHAQRLAALANHGVPSSDAERIVGPIGLIPAARDPETLALSVLAQIVAIADAREPEIS